MLFLRQPSYEGTSDADWPVTKPVEAKQSGPGWLDYARDAYVQGAQGFNRGLDNTFNLPNYAVNALARMAGYGDVIEPARLATRFNTGEVPKTAVGKYAGSIGEFAPGALLVPGGSVAKNALNYAVLPGVASEAAGQATEGTAWEPYARLAGGVAGPLAPSGVNALARRMVPSAAEASRTMSIFAGPGAATANRVALMRAEEMERKGSGADEIWRATGWGRGVDGKWRFEIDDSAMKLAPPVENALANGGRVNTTLAAGVEHPELYAAYPPGGMQFIAEQGARNDAYAAPGQIYLKTRDAAQGRSITLHELQHPVQSLEGWAVGGSPKMFSRELPDGGYDNGFAAYKRLAGEVEARNVQARAGMTAEERRAIPPWYTEDVPRGQQIVWSGNGQNALAMSVEDVKPGIRAYHGSPHDFDAFDISKIGTGEGNQSYGHGLYFAENEGVAKAYRDELSPKQVMLAGHTFEWGRNGRGGDPNEIAKALGLKDPREIDQAAEFVGEAIRKNTSPLEVAKQVARESLAPETAEKLIPKFEMAGFSIKRQPGVTYEVNINANPENFLDWDRPLSKQSQYVQRAAKKYGLTETQTPDGPMAVGGDLYRMYGNPAYAPGKAEVPADVSNNLRNVGIPGIKYFDKGSRATSVGTRNYVVFDDKLISIIRKYGIGPAIGLGLLTSDQARELQAQGY